jgi:predicted RNase H-like nuclease (RuvC/YqgF family)
MSNFLNLIKDVASVVGCIISCITLAGLIVSLIVKPVRKAISKKIINITHSDEIKKNHSEAIKKQNEEIKKQNEEIKKQGERMDALQKTFESNSEDLKEIKELIFINEKDRLRGELFNCGNRCRRSIPLSLEEYRYIQTVGDKYLHTLKCNSIGEDEYRYICNYYESEENQRMIKKY